MLCNFNLQYMCINYRTCFKPYHAEPRYISYFKNSVDPDLSIYLLILQHPLAGIMCRCPVCFRPGVSAVKVKIGQKDKNR